MYYHLTASLFIEQKVRAPLVARFLMLPVNLLLCDQSPS